MKTKCLVRIQAGGPWRSGWLVEYATPGPPIMVAIVDGQPLGPQDVDCIGVLSSCPIGLLDAAVDFGFFVLGQPALERNS